MNLKTCVAPSGKFIFGTHRPDFEVRNLRKHDRIAPLGIDENNAPVDNRVNFPSGTVAVDPADWVFEIPNAFPFRGATFIARSWADEKAAHPETIRLQDPPEMSLGQTIRQWLPETDKITNALDRVFALLPEPIQLATAVNSTDPDDLVRLAKLSCRLIFNANDDQPIGLGFKTRSNGRRKPNITRPALFKAVANNPYLPDMYKKAMVLRPGIQGPNEIVGEWHEKDGNGHVYEYLRKNSYIPWGHYAANMADDAVRYRIPDLTIEDINGMRHLYYQRTYTRMADQLDLKMPATDRSLNSKELERLRQAIQQALLNGKTQHPPAFNRTLWGWNFGFDYAPSHYRLHASHQQIHQQYALLPEAVGTGTDNRPELSSYGCGDLVEAFIQKYRQETGQSFFDRYLKAIDTNQRMDGHPNRPASLIVYRDDRVHLFVPKAQTSQWELQLMTRMPVGNILETDTATRDSLNRGIYVAVQVLAALGARLITSIEFSKRFDAPDLGQRLLYSFLPRLPYSPGAFSEAQLRWINGHYPEDFAAACRNQAAQLSL
jgi:hypothetical protein